MDNHRGNGYYSQQFEMVRKGMGMSTGSFNFGHSKEDNNGYVDLTLRLGLPAFHKNQNNLNVISQTQMLTPLNNLLPQPQPQTPYFNYIEYASRARNFYQAMPCGTSGNMNMMLNGLNSSGEHDNGSADGINQNIDRSTTAAILDYLQQNNAYLSNSGSYNSTTFYSALDEEPVTLAPPYYNCLTAPYTYTTIPYNYNNNGANFSSLREPQPQLMPGYIPHNSISTALSTTTTTTATIFASVGGGSGSGVAASGVRASSTIVGGVGFGVTASGADPGNISAGIGCEDAIIGIVGAGNRAINASSTRVVAESQSTSSATRRNKKKRVLVMEEQAQEDRGDNLKRCSNRNCDTYSTPMWRKGPLGPKTLCNACGIKYRKQEEKKIEKEGNTT